MAAADPLKPLVPSNLISCYGLEKPSSQSQMFQRKKQDDSCIQKITALPMIEVSKMINPCLLTPASLGWRHLLH